jgi:hypothetical protein
MLPENSREAVVGCSATAGMRACQSAAANTEAWRKERLFTTTVEKDRIERTDFSSIR